MIKSITLLIFIIGIGLIIYSFKLPYYTNPVEKEKLELDINDKILSSNGKSINQNKAEYYKAVEKLKTNKNIYFDLGSGISVASLVIALFLFAYKINHFEDFTKVKTFNKTLIFITAILTWLIMIPGTFWYYSFRAERGDYPMFADSVAIPIMYATISILVGLTVLVVFLIVTTRKSIFPTLIFIKKIYYTKSDIFSEILWGMLLLLNLLCFISFVIDGDHISIIVNLFFTYLILVLRAGQINTSNINRTQRVVEL